MNDKTKANAEQSKNSLAIINANANRVIETGDTIVITPGSKMIFVASLLLVLISTMSVLNVMFNSWFRSEVFGLGAWNIPMTALFAAQFALGVLGFMYGKSVEKGKWLFFMAVCFLAATISMEAVWSMAGSLPFNLRGIAFVLVWPHVFSVELVFSIVLFLAGTYKNTSEYEKQFPSENVFSRETVHGRLSIDIFLVITFTVILSAIAFVSTSFDTVQATISVPPAGTTVTQEADARAGDIIYFGGQRWLVLEARHDRMLIIVENVLEHRQYHHERGTHVTWASSDIRSYLNNTFFHTFSEADRRRILPTRVSTNANRWFHARGGRNTIDRVFLLSIEEVVLYFGDSGMLANRPLGAWGVSDGYGIQRIAMDTEGTASRWWLRSPGRDLDFAASVGSLGDLYLNGRAVFASDGVRPALWLSRMNNGLCVKRGL